MLKRILAFVKNKDIHIYLVFGVLTTVVNWLVLLVLHDNWGLTAKLSNALAWVVSVLFAFLTNKSFVFHSDDWTAKTVIPEGAKFFGSRLISGFMETEFLSLMVDVLGYSIIIWKIVASVIVIIINYIASKFFAFKK